MADQQITSGIGVKEKMKDMGDGTHARVVFNANTGGAGGDASAANQVAGNAILTTIAGKLPANVGAKSADASLSTVPATDANVARETYTAVTIMEVLTHASAGATTVAFSGQACSSLDIVNAGTADIEYQRGGAGLFMTVAAGSSRLVQGITNANQISVRRVDQSSATRSTVKAEAFAV